MGAAAPLPEISEWTLASLHTYRIREESGSGVPVPSRPPPPVHLRTDDVA